MAVRLILRGRVQGVACRHYCSTYGRRLGIRGSATNLRDGSVQVLLNSENEELINIYIRVITENTENIPFFGKITSIEKQAYRGSFRGDYEF